MLRRGAQSAYGCVMSNVASTPTRIEGIQSIDRAVAVLDLLGGRGEASVSEVAAELGVHKSTASRMLAVLETHGLVEVTRLRGRYKLGYGLVRLAGMVGTKLDVVGQGSEICAELASWSGESVTLTVRQDDQAITIHQASSRSRSIMVNSWLGRPTPLHATSSGKVLLAAVPGVQRDRLLGRRLTGYTDQTITSVVRLRRELDEVAVRGFATAPEEFEPGLSGVAAPVFAQDGSVACALSVSGPSERIAERTRNGLVSHVVSSAAQLSLRMGHHG